MPISLAKSFTHPKRSICFSVSCFKVRLCHVIIKWVDRLVDVFYLAKKPNKRLAYSIRQWFWLVTLTFGFWKHLIRILQRWSFLIQTRIPNVARNTSRDSLKTHKYTQLCSLASQLKTVNFYFDAPLFILVDSEYTQSTVDSLWVSSVLTCMHTRKEKRNRLNHCDMRVNGNGKCILENFHVISAVAWPWATFMSGLIQPVVQ